MPLELSRGIFIMAKKTKKSPEEDFGPRVKSSGRDQQFMRVEIRYIPTSDADWRLHRAIDILLRLAANESEGSINAKEEEPPQDMPEKVTEGGDGEKT